MAEFQGWRIFMQTRQRIFKSFTMQICRLFFTAFWNFSRITRLSTTKGADTPAVHTIAELSTLKQVRFLADPAQCHVIVRKFSSTRTKKLDWKFHFWRSLKAKLKLWAPHSISVRKLQLPISFNSWRHWPYSSFILFLFCSLSVYTLAK